MRVAILGGTGFIGSHLTRLLVQDGVDVTVVSRHPKVGAGGKGRGMVEYARWNGSSVQELIPIVEKADGVVNLVGEGIADKRWTPERKQAILKSRVDAASALCSAIQQADSKPDVVVQASAIGYYGYKYERKDRIEADEFSEVGTGFLAEVCKQWEDAILPLEDVVARLVIVRTGIVLGFGGGFLGKQLPLFKLGLGGSIGKGVQPFSWIHIDDEVGAILHLLRSRESSGVYNLVAPNPCSYSSFVKTLGGVLHRPALLGIPIWAVKLLFGEEMANEVIVGGKIVVPRRLLESGYSFKYPLLQDALTMIVKKD